MWIPDEDLSIAKRVFPFLRLQAFKQFLHPVPSVSRPIWPGHRGQHLIAVQKRGVVLSIRVAGPLHSNVLHQTVGEEEGREC